MCAANQKDSRDQEEIRKGQASLVQQPSIQQTPIQQTPFVQLGREVCAELASAESREWLVTNGLGSFASGTVAGILTRRYHGLLIAALDPPQKRTLLVTKVDEIASVGGAEFMLGANRWRGGVVDPQGYTLLESFWLEGSVPVWSFQFGGAILEKRVWMQHGANTTFVEYRLVKTSALVRGGDGAAEVVALGFFAVVGLQEIQLGLGFHAFGYHAEFQALGHAEDGGDDGSFVRRGGDLADEGLIDFQRIDGKFS